MPQSKMLLDTCSYLRLARSIHPLLFVEFGEERYCLYVIEDFQEEFGKSRRLRTKFTWVSEEQYKENRSKSIDMSKKARKTIDLAYNYILEFADTNGFGISRIDGKAIAAAYVLEIPLISDDSDLLSVCQEFAVKTLKTIELLLLMKEHQHIDMSKIREIAAYWHYERDTPKNFRDDYQKLFGEVPPKDF